ncbi:MAG: hypothetical protein IJU52_05825 [Clostridia bacterium]|nr:hypothetical protein [Clostridia bacterium]
MTTPALVETIVTCPFFINVYASSISVDDGFRLLENVFDGVRVLYERADAADSVKAFIEKAEKESENGDPGKLAIYAATLLEHLERTVIRREDDDGQILKAGVYRRSGSGEYSAFRLNENRTYSFPTSLTSSVLIGGSYRVKDGYLYLGPFVFEILDDGGLKYSLVKSRELISYLRDGPVKDGAVFILTE